MYLSILLYSGISGYGGVFMLKDKKILEQHLSEQCYKIAFNNKKCKSVYTYASERYEVPKGITLDLISERLMLSEVSEFVLFTLLDSMHQMSISSSIKSVDEFYTAQEIDFYRKSKYKNNKIKFPLVFKMIQIEDDQWTGKIDARTLMQLREAQLISYNANAQRTMQRIVRGDKERFRIMLNKKAVEEIADGYRNGVFIPNTLTFNIPEDTNADFYYDEETCSLIIKSLERLDITDGYHRYISLCQVCDENKDFNYNMEFRVVNFSEDKAKQMIFQEDQKTKIKKTDSNSLNMNKAANIVVTRLNENVRCNLKGLISRNEGVISFGEMAALVDYFYFRGVSKEKERITIIETVKELTEKFNALTEYNPKYMEEKIKYKALLVIMYCFAYFKEEDNIDIYPIIEKVTEKMEQVRGTRIHHIKPSKALLTMVENFVKEVM